MPEVLLQKKSHAQFILLLDPDKTDIGQLETIIPQAIDAGVDIFFIGSSLILNSHFDLFVEKTKQFANEKPVILFPGNSMQVSRHADAILFMSLISGRNPEFLINQQVIAAPGIKMAGIKTIPMAYMLVESGVTTSVEFMSNTKPLPSGKNDIAVAHALAAEMLGFQIIYLEAGSGAKFAVPNAMVKAVSHSVKLPIIVGGGIKDPQTAREKVLSGASMVVCGNLFESNAYNQNLMKEIAEAIHTA